MSAAYPPEPWDLGGRGRITLWRVPVAALPGLPSGVRPLAVAGRALVATAFVEYDDSGLLGYRELLAAPLVRHRRAVGLSITDIWVDSAASRAGGRELWGIPKELATFDGLACADPAGAIAAATFRPRRLPALPLPWPMPTRCVQTLGGRTVHTRLRAAGRVRAASASWELAPEGPLGWLRAGRPVASVSADSFRLTFGPRIRG